MAQTTRRWDNPMPATISITGQTHVTGLTNLREGAPNTKAPVRRKLTAGAALHVEGLVVGESVQGNAQWYRIDAPGYVGTGACEPLQTVVAPPAQPVAVAPAAVDPALAK